MTNSVERLSPGIAERPGEYDLSTLAPVLVPRTFSETGQWPGPIYQLAAADFDLTWAILGSDDSVTYVSRVMQAHWESRGEDWQGRAELNLRVLAEAEPFSHVRTRPDGSAYLVIMLYGQNLGPSRLLVRGLLNDTFPDGYMVAVPEQTCAVAFTSDPTGEEAVAIAALITGLFERGSEPVSTARYAPETLWELSSGDLGSD